MDNFYKENNRNNKRNFNNTADFNEQNRNINNRNINNLANTYQSAEVIGITEWTILNMISKVPIIGLLVLAIMAGRRNERNLDRKNYLRAKLIYLLLRDIIEIAVFSLSAKWIAEMLLNLL